ncbi:MAG: MFS transporter [Caulobacter sp.]|nr:MFS transporter [Caulobacter sp.]
MTTPPSPSDASSWRELLDPALASRFAFLCLGIWLNAADALVTVTLTPTIAAEIGGYQYFGWSVAAFLLASIIAGATSGRLSLMLGLRPATALAGGAYALGCAVSALAPDFMIFIVGRLIQGLGAGAVVALCYVAINSLFPERLWVRVFGAIAGVWGVATLIGPLIGGLFAEGGVWRDAFWFFGAQGVIFMAATFLMLRRTPRDAAEPTRVPVPQLAVLTLGVTLIAAAGVTGSAYLAGLLGASGLASLVLLLRIDARAGGVLLPLSAGDLTRAAGAGYLMIFGLEAATIAFTVYGPAFVQVLHGASPLVAGYVITAIAAGWTVVAMLTAGIRNHDGLMIRLGGGLVLAGTAWAVWAVPQGSLLSIVLAMLLMGAGFGASWAFVAKRIVASLPERERPLGSSALPTAQLIGGAFGAAGSSAIAGALGYGAGIDPVDAPVSGLWLFGLFLPVSLVGWLAAWRLGGLKPDDVEGG